MALTRKQLKDMQLDDAQIEEIIAAHAASMEGLIAERDELRAAAAKAELLQLELDALRETSSQAEQLRQERDELLIKAEQLAAAQAEAEEARAALSAYEAKQLAQLRAAALRTVLLEAGCNEAAADLLAREVDPAAIQMENGEIADAAALVAPLRTKYPALFAKPVRLPTAVIAPPIATGGAMTREDLARMSTEEINRNWNAVKGVLAKGAM